MLIGQFYTDIQSMGHKDFYTRVKREVKVLNTTIEAVVKEAGLTRAAYDSYSRHNNLPRADEAVKIAKILKTSVEYLVTGEHPLFSIDQVRFKQNLQGIKDLITNLENVYIK